MKAMKMLVAIGCMIALLAGSARSAEKQEKKLTCCEKAAATDKECKHKCCLTAHKDGKYSEKCNPNKEDLKIKKKKNQQTNKTAGK